MGLVLSRTRFQQDVAGHHYLWKKSKVYGAAAAATSHGHRNSDFGSGSTFFRFPPLRGNILVVGDGDFAYSAACARANQSSGSNAKIIASSLDSKKEVVKKYSHAEENIDLLNHSSRVGVRHNFDAVHHGSFGGNRVWDSIVWNFPYPPISPNSGNHREMRVLLDGFFQNAVPSLKLDGTIYITLGIQQAKKEMWQLEEVAQRHGLDVYSVVSFEASNIHGYEPKRSYNDQKIPNFKSCTYELRMKNHHQSSRSGNQ
mmetsp:Transcript_11075/g.21915  ORF Transcript_11075/g.21915 Transcript_11075/m.21915 type:complete len:257 (+) Transcript_11075:152-922(+)